MLKTRGNWINKFLQSNKKQNKTRKQIDKQQSKPIILIKKKKRRKDKRKQQNEL